MNLSAAYIQKQKEWKEEGRQEGHQEGRQEGRSERQQEVAIALLQAGVSLGRNHSSHGYIDRVPAKVTIELGGWG
jgi:flagellar biosynthesis/type III secretory pathway protein FliH